MLAIYFLAFLHVTIENETFHVSPDFTIPPPYLSRSHMLLVCLSFFFSWSIVSFVLNYAVFIQHGL